MNQHCCLFFLTKPIIIYIYDCMWICLQNHPMDSWMGDRRNILSFPTSWLGHLCLQYLAKSVKSFLVCSGSIDIWWHEIADLLINGMEGRIYIQITGWWFGTFFIFPYIGNNHPNWRIFFRGVETTNQTILFSVLECNVFQEDFHWLRWWYLWAIFWSVFISLDNTHRVI